MSQQSYLYQGFWLMVAQILLEKYIAQSEDDRGNWQDRVLIRSILGTIGQGASQPTLKPVFIGSFED